MGRKVEPVKKIRIGKQSKRTADEQDNLSRTLRNDVRYIGAHADYRREDFVFARTQSLAMQAREWENRLEPIRGWGSNLVANLAFEIFA
jgi:hypothetical protein